jgi:outer membrane protein assembly factor BamB
VFLRKAYHTPVLVEVDGQIQLVSNGALLVTGHEPQTGRELWRVRYRDDNTISRIVSGHGLLFVNCGGPPNATRLWAVRQGGTGDVTNTHVAWKMTEDVPLESSPVLVGDLLYTISDRGVLICKQAMIGETVWTERLSGRHGASLLYADNRIYVFSKQGKTTVIEPGRTFRTLAVNALHGGFWASPAVAGKSLLLRTRTHLYRVENE